MPRNLSIMVVTSTRTIEGDTTMSAAVFAELAEVVGKALLKCAEDIRSAEVNYLTIEPTIDPVAELTLGQRQREMVEILRTTEGAGRTTSEVCEQMGGYDPANGHVALRSLHSRGVIEEVPGERPMRWRLAARYRATAEPYLVIAEQVRAGEWTTYGDVSIAVRGDTTGARAVGRAAAMLEHFPNAHRVLQQGGQVPEGWRSTGSEQPNPDECRLLLEAEGVRFDRHGRAERENYVSWEVLDERAKERRGA